MSAGGIVGGGRIYQWGFLNKDFSKTQKFFQNFSYRNFCARMTSMKQTILVDWTLYKQSSFAQQFLEARVGQARMILLVSDPNTDDFEYTPTSELEWDAVIRNTGGKPDVEFKKKAFSVIQDATDLIPIIGLDLDHRVNTFYRNNGVLITTDNLVKEN